MNKRGQAALEYLMTYGWALIVIAIVVGVLVFIVAAPTSSTNCTSSAPGKINVVSNNLAGAAAADIGDIVITNLTAGPTTVTSCTTGTGYFAASACDAITSTSLPVGNTTLSMNGTAGTTASGTFVIEYTDVSTLTQTATISCQGASITVTT